MKKDKLAQALDFISPRKLEEALKQSAVRKRRRYFRMALAACLALVFISRIGFIPMSVPAKAVALTEGSRVEQRPDREDYPDYESFRSHYERWMAEKDQRFADAETAARQALPFFREGSRLFLSGTQNSLWAPANAWIGLAMLAETTGGDTRQQLLELLGADSLEQLRTEVSAVWETTNRDDGNEICILANSLWLDSDLDYIGQTMENLAHYHYADVYQGDFGTARTDKAMQTWLSNHTGGLLKRQAGTVSMPEDTVLALASTIYFQSKWSDEFSAARNTHDVFHAPGGDVTATYMNKKLAQMYYYWGDSFGAVSLWLKNGSRMWFVLPDADKTIDDVLKEGQYLEIITNSAAFQETNGKYMKVNLSVPKFDVASSRDLKQGLQAMGISNVFTPGTANFTPAIENEMVFVSSVNQAVRVQIDEQGVKAAAYIEIPGAGAAAPPEEIIDFILDRPFLFVITSNNLPLFAGAVNTP